MPYRLVPSVFGINEGLVTSVRQSSKLHLLIKCLTEQLLSSINFKNEILGMFFFRCRAIGDGVEVSF